MKCRLLFFNRFEKPKVRWQKIKNITANRLLTAMVIEMKNEISQTIRHCQARAIINKTNIVSRYGGAFGNYL